MTFADSVQVTCWQNIVHAEGHTYVVVAVGRKQDDIVLAVRRRLLSLHGSHVQEQAAIARLRLIQVLREIADRVESGVAQS